MQKINVLSYFTINRNKKYFNGSSSYLGTLEMTVYYFNDDSCHASNAPICSIKVSRSYAISSYLLNSAH